MMSYLHESSPADIERFERLYREVENTVDGFKLYSEGIFEDVNKVVITGIYCDPSKTSDDILDEYADLDREIFTSRSLHTPVADKCYEELVKLYHGERQLELLLKDHAYGITIPPYDPAVQMP